LGHIQKNGGGKTYRVSRGGGRALRKGELDVPKRAGKKVRGVCLMKGGANERK